MRVTPVLLSALLALVAAEGGFQPVAAPAGAALPAEARDSSPVAEADSSGEHVSFSEPPAEAEARDSGVGLGGHGGHAAGGGYGPALDSYSSYGGGGGGYDAGYGGGYDAGYGGGYDAGYGGGYDTGYGGQGYVQQGGYAGGYGDYAHGGGYGGYEEVVVEEKPWYEKYINRYKFPIFIPKFNFVTVDSSILDRIPPAKGGGKGKGGGFGSGISNYFKGFFGGGKGKGKGKGGKDETIIVNHHHYYDEGYGHGQKGYAPPVPASSYGAPPAAGYGAPLDPGYGAPAADYGAPAPVYR
ncbi:hypothetical protein FJT64_001682 [Amphibalanus amphitrite]|uniref:Uncharacterized protein n=1 Tax=Amphibalanus amphitrite TaxID=1232801 RepID=A0A6A4X3V9_AMPAM|nr:hypothetical protein FJT64_001682 [Amphibalanus amphitrite]